MPEGWEPRRETRVEGKGGWEPGRTMHASGRLHPTRTRKRENSVWGGFGGMGKFAVSQMLGGKWYWTITGSVLTSVSH